MDVKKDSRRKIIIQVLILGGYLLFLALSFLFDFEAGKQIGANFINFGSAMLIVLPFAFVLIGLFEVWVSRERVEKHLGEESGFKGYLWAILLAGTVVGPLYVALPVAHSLYKKGARLGVIFSYISAAAICRIPMATFEASFLGLKFTLVRLAVSLPLVILCAAILEKYLVTANYRMEDAG